MVAILGPRLHALAPAVAGFVIAMVSSGPNKVLAATSSPRFVVSYVVSAAEDSAAQIEDEALPARLPPSHPWHWRVFDPTTRRDTLFMALSSFPTRVRWDSAFRSVEYVVANHIERAPWRLGARPEEQARVPADSSLCDFWSDSEGHWHVITQIGVDERPKPGYAAQREFGTRWDQDKAGKWRAAEGDSMLGSYEGCLGWEKLAGEPARFVMIRLADLVDSMSIVKHNTVLLRRLPAPPDDESYPAIVWEPFEKDSTIGLEIRSEMGDEDHAMEPVLWVDKKHRRQVTICGRGGTHDDAFGAVAFAQRGDFLLVAAEYSGAYPIVADMRAGTVVFQVSRPSARAVWVPAPR